LNNIPILQALTSISRENNSTIIFPLPIDLMKRLGSYDEDDSEEVDLMSQEDLEKQHIL